MGCAFFFFAVYVIRCVLCGYAQSQLASLNLKCSCTGCFGKLPGQVDSQGCSKTGRQVTLAMVLLRVQMLSIWYFGKGPAKYRICRLQERCKDT